jgi:hypothetical protein
MSAQQAELAYFVADPTAVEILACTDGRLVHNSSL